MEPVSIARLILETQRSQSLVRGKFEECRHRKGIRGEGRGGGGGGLEAGLKEVKGKAHRVSDGRRDVVW